MPFPSLFSLPKLEDFAYGKHRFFLIMQIYSIYFKLEKTQKNDVRFMKTDTYVFEDFYVRFENLYFGRIMYLSR